MVFAVEWGAIIMQHPVYFLVNKSSLLTLVIIKECMSPIQFSILETFFAKKTPENEPKMLKWVLYPALYITWPDVGW